MKHKKNLLKLIKRNDLATKIKLKFSSNLYGDWYDPYENNVKSTNLNPITIKAYVNTLSAEKAYYKQYGENVDDVKEIYTEDKYANYFKNCSEIEIDSNNYQTYRSGTGNNVTIKKLPYKMMRVTVTRKA